MNDEQAARPVPAMGLLDQIADTALDDDYYVVRAPLAPHARRTREFNTALTGIVLTIFALLITIAAVQTRADRPATELERRTLAQDVEARKATQTEREDLVASLRADVIALEASADRYDPKYEALRVQAADQAATGPGVRIVVDDSDITTASGGQITAHDLQILVNALWYAGAEAISVNGSRLSSLSAIGFGGGSIKVNYRSIGAPFTIVALGDGDSLATRFADNPGGHYWAARQDSAGVTLAMTRSASLSVPAAPQKRRELNHATATEDAS